MLKKIGLAGAIVFAGSLFASQRADAYDGRVIRYGSPVLGPVVRAYRPYVAPRYQAGYRYGYQPSYRYGYQPSYRYGYRPGYPYGYRPGYPYGYAPGYRYGAPGYRSYRAPFVGPGAFGYPPYGRTGGFSLYIGPSWRGW